MTRTRHAARTARPTTRPTTRPARAASLLAASALAVALGVSGCATATEAAEPAAAAAQSETRTVETAFGQVTIPADPQQVVALEGGAGPLLEAGIVPVATADGDWPDAFLPAEYEQIADLPIVLGADGWDYEKIASLRPDLIVGFVRGGQEEELSAEKHEEYDKLSQIAPTVLIRATGSAAVKDASVEIATAVGAGEEAADAKAAYEARVAELRDTYADVLAANTFAALDSFEEVTVYSKISWLGGILDDLGAPLPQVVADETQENAAFLSYEQLGQISDATVVLYEQTVDGVPGPGAEELAAASTYQELAAVEAGHAYGIRYFFADRYSLALDVLDQLEVVLEDLQG